MKIIVVKDYEEMSAKCAEIFINQLKNKPNSVLGLATGGSPVGTYKKIVEAYSPTEVTFWFGENFDTDIVGIEDFKECPLFDFH